VQNITHVSRNRGIFGDMTNKAGSRSKNPVKTSYIHIHTYTYMNIHIHIYLHIQTYIYIHTYIIQL